MDVSTSPPLSPGVGVVLPTPVANAGTQPKQLAGLMPPVAVGRAVLDGAFAVLDALARADEGLGLTALARASGLAKTRPDRRP
jgi:IclR-like helix-turn-helix domain-containing protein